MSPVAAMGVGLVLGYVLGSIPASYLAGRWSKGIDLREQGSGNLGATNAFRTLGIWVAIPVFICDLGKGALAVWLAFHFLPQLGFAPDLVALLAAVGAVLGHSFSPFVGFHGGKGVATASGAFLTLAPWAMIPALVVWLTLLLSTRIMSVASIAGAIVLPVNLVMVEWLLRSPDRPLRVASMVVVVILGAWVVMRHRSNLQRLRDGTEKGLW
jgi:acyl phosphate:glycerol-3-phosphate acyltransferase